MSSIKDASIKPVCSRRFTAGGFYYYSYPPVEGEQSLYDSAALEAARQEVREKAKEAQQMLSDMHAAEVADLRRQLASIEQEATAKAVADTIERCAKLCERYGDDKRALYKGRHPYTGNEEGRADPYVDGVSDGALYCCDAIRALLTKEPT